MGYYRKKWTPSKAAKENFVSETEKIIQFCRENGICRSLNGDSYYFILNEKKYRVSNHSIEASNRAAYDALTGEKKRDLYHGQREEDTIYIHAGKLRIIEIYNDLKNGYELDGRGYRKIF